MSIAGRNRPLTTPCRMAASLVVITLVLASAPASSAWAQSAAIAGRVVDAQGGAVVGADVTLTSVARRTVMTLASADGAFRFDGLVPAEYTVHVDAPGFVQWSQKVTASPQSTMLTIELQVAGVAESVNVVGTSPTTLTRPTLTGSRLGLTPLETPASVQIISGDAIRERGDQTVADAKTRAVGVTMQGDPGNGGGAVVARGFGGVGSVMQLFDGDQLFVGAGTVTFPFDPWTVERIEVLGGPSSVLYGNGAIGGVINVVPRKPNPFSRENAIRLSAGSFNTWRGAIDSAGPINDRTSYRVDLSSQRSSGWMTDGESKSAAFSGSIRHELRPDLTLTVSEDFGYQNPNTYFGSPTFDGVIRDDLRKVNYNVSDADIWYKDNWTQAKLEWQPTPTVRVRTGLHLLATNRHWKNVEGYTFNPSTNLIDRDTYIEIFHRQRQYGDRTDAVFSNRVMDRANTLSVGFDYNVITFQHTNNSPYGGASTTTLQNTTSGGFLNLAGTTPKYRTRTHQVAFFAEDRLVLTPKVSLVGGVRVDRYAVERSNLLTSAVVDRTYTPTSGRGGVVYTVKPGLSVYGQFATATDTIGNVISNSPGNLVFDPTTGRQVEGGVKQSLWNQRAEWTVAGYHIVKTKLLAPVPGRPAERQQIGSQSSRGLEATAAVNLPVGLRLDGNVAVLDAKFDDFGETIGGVLVSRNGNTPPSIPERSVNLWLTWNAPQDWQFRGGIRSVGRRFWDNTNTTEQPGYTVLDAGARKRLSSALALDLHLYNLTNELYATDFYYNEFAPQWMLGTPRSAQVALTVGF
jgi:iron complex outermembrane receptor protein